MKWLVITESSHDAYMSNYDSYNAAESEYEERNPSKGETIYLVSISRQKECKVVEVIQEE